MSNKKYSVRLLSLSLLLFIFVSISSYADAVARSESALLAQTCNLDQKVLENALTQYYCARNNGINPKQYLTVIDYRLPSTSKRLWLFDVTKNKLLLNTWVAHGIKSGDLYSQSFSNSAQSHKSSLGLFQTTSTYGGSHGTSLRINGLSPGYNSNAMSRAVVVHGAWYVSQDFINKYGRLGRSWGCPAVSMNVSYQLINIIKNGSLIYSYYPDSAWLRKQSYLNCGTA